MPNKQLDITLSEWFKVLLDLGIAYKEVKDEVLKMNEFS